MKLCVFLASPRKNGNTASLVEPFQNTITALGAEVRFFSLYEKNIQPCIACRQCQKDWNIFGCIHKDDVQEMFDAALASDCIVFATPIYSWYCTPPMKALLDRFVYGMNKFYGDEEIGPALLKDKICALITTCGYKPERGADLWEEGIKRYCKHSSLRYYDMLCCRHLGYKTTFMDDEKEAMAEAFAEDLYGFVEKNTKK